MNFEQGRPQPATGRRRRAPTKPFYFRMNSDLRAELERAAERYNEDLCVIVQRALREFLAGQTH